MTFTPILPVPRWKQRPWLEQVGGKRHKVTREGIYLAADRSEFHIPKGFETDGGSVPRPLWWWMPPFGDGAESGYVLHDMLYRLAEIYPGMTRKRADDLLREAAIAEGLPKARARVIWLGVRLGGGGIWERYRAQAADEPEAA